MARVSLTELRQYIEDFEHGLTMRLDDQDARLAGIENDLAIVKEYLVTKMRTAAETDPHGPVRERPAGAGTPAVYASGAPEAADEDAAAD